MIISSLTRTIVSALATADGGTWDDAGNALATGYVVAVQDSPELRIACREATAQITAAWLALPSVYGPVQDDGACIGAWIDDDGRVCLDVVEVLPTLDAALTAGRERGEDAVFSLADGVTHYCR